MEKLIQRKTFKHGDSTAVRLPKAWGFGPGETFEVTQRGDRIYLRWISTPPLAQRPGANAAGDGRCGPEGGAGVN